MAGYTGCHFYFDKLKEKLEHFFNLRAVSYQMNCRYCSKPCVKAGFQKNGTQKFYCKECQRYQQAVYSSEAYHPELNKRIAALVTEGMGLRSISRLMHISLKTVIDRIKRIARSISKPFSLIKNTVYEIDELWTYVGSKANEVWLMYAFDRNTKTVIDFKVGPRTKLNLQTLTDQLLLLEPQKICTDGLNIYKTLLPETIHRVGLTNTRHIERHNLNIRTHLKRLSRKTICYSKRAEMLEACLKIYFWKT